MRRLKDIIEYPSSLKQLKLDSSIANLTKRLRLGLAEFSDYGCMYSYFNTLSNIESGEYNSLAAISFNNENNGIRFYKNNNYSTLYIRSKR